MNPRHWTNQEKDYLREHYPHQKTETVAKALGRSYNAVLSYAYKLGVQKTLAYKQKEAERLATTGAKFRFKKGMTPVNKGKKLTDFMSPEGIENSKKTRFKKGQTPHNTKERNGIVVNRLDNTGRVYKYIRLGVADWKPLHRHVWEQANGLIPKDHVIIFLDNNTENCKLENLKCVSKAENMLRNSKFNFPEEIIPSMLLMNQLETKLKTLQNG